MTLWNATCTLPRKRTFAGSMLMLIVLTSSSPAFSAPENRPYDANLLRLSEIIGTIHYLRALCGINDKLIWRKKMEKLIATEGVTVKRKLKLTKSFNKGYKSFQRTYRVCTPSAKVAIDHFLDEGIEISEKLTTTNN